MLGGDLGVGAWAARRAGVATWRAAVIAGEAVRSVRLTPSRLHACINKIAAGLRWVVSPAFG
ncbi:hypothetical protein Acor_44960 [Acrocarpospora corrugata]|uniref:Uncharacterized protein n=1 Tax=Acrocarpospora corrugata TaxID=35763 RepID=A0A5M3W2F8_9ACTN|nr:hypothetical protein Acor_44960 [Acrocarpospora corrugata]